MMNYIKNNTKQIIIVSIIVAGLIATLILVQQTQIFKPRAGAEGLVIYSNEGTPVHFKETDDLGSYYETEAESVQFSIQDLERLK